LADVAGTDKGKVTLAASPAARLKKVYSVQLQFSVIKKELQICNPRNILKETEF